MQSLLNSCITLISKVYRILPSMNGFSKPAVVTSQSSSKKTIKICCCCVVVNKGKLSLLTVCKQCHADSRICHATYPSTYSRMKTQDSAVEVHPVREMLPLKSVAEWKEWPPILRGYRFSATQAIAAQAIAQVQLKSVANSILKRKAKSCDLRLLC